MARKKKKRFIVSVKDFGAKGDGFTDDTEAFRMAARCRASCVVVPPGRYEIQGDVHLDPRFVEIKK